MTNYIFNEAFSHFGCETKSQKQSDLLAFIDLRNAYSIEHLLSIKMFIEFIRHIFTHNQYTPNIMNIYNELKAFEAKSLQISGKFPNNDKIKVIMCLQYPISNIQIVKQSSTHLLNNIETVTNEIMGNSAN